jgi:dTDP-4-dehydrorhamnose reductase
MKILITGSNGMLGRALCQEMTSKYEIVGMDVVRLQATGCRLQAFVQCDIAERERTIAEIISVSPDVVIHTAAYTNVDGCELDKKKAHKINALGTETVALASQECNAFLFYISTDFVFDGEKKSAYIELDEPNPINIYGQSKLEGEKYVQSILKKFIIIRSSWLFGEGGRNFVNTILEKAQNEKEVKVVNNQCGSPTYTNDLASAISRLISVVNSLSGIYHITNSGSCSWYEFAQAIKEIASLDIDIIPISAAQYHSPARRPEVSVLENRRYQEYFGQKLRSWKEALRMYLSE